MSSSGVEQCETSKSDRHTVPANDNNLTTAHSTTAHSTTAHSTTAHSTTAHSTTAHSTTAYSTTTHYSSRHLYRVQYLLHHILGRYLFRFSFVGHDDSVSQNV